MSVGHYENFPVASIALPAHLRQPVKVIYRFARSADDIADEGVMPAAERLSRLDAYRHQLNLIAAGRTAKEPLFVDLQRVIAAHRLPLEPFYDLLDAFEQDVTTTRYPTFDELLDYCRRSANPVGRLMLHLYDAATAQNVLDSDQICTGLQIANFLQDVAIDCGKGRIYLPQDELTRFGVAEAQIHASDPSGQWPALMRFQVDRCDQLLLGGSTLGSRLRGRMGLELRMIVAGGRRILRKIMLAKGDVYAHRPVLRAADWPLLVARSVLRF
jgi:squalene synthase HpnC